MCLLFIIWNLNVIYLNKVAIELTLSLLGGGCGSSSFSACLFPILLCRSKITRMSIIFGVKLVEEQGCATLRTTRVLSVNLRSFLGLLASFPLFKNVHDRLGSQILNKHSSHQNAYLINVLIVDLNHGSIYACAETLYLG